MGTCIIVELKEEGGGLRIGRFEQCWLPGNGSTDDPWATKVFKFQSFHRLLWIRKELGAYENLNT